MSSFKHQSRSLRIFQFLRGAVRSVYGIEDFRDKKILIVGMGKVAQEVLSRLCIDNVDIKFQDPSVTNYRAGFFVCRDIDVYNGGRVDITIDFFNGRISVGKKSFPINKIGYDAYNQGIHEFYL